MNKIFSWFLILMVFLSSCNTELDLNDEWKDLTVVYCLLNQNDTVNYAKITKAFLGSADAYDMAQISDSLFYDNLNVSLEEYNANGSVTNTYTLTKTNNVPKDSGIFASDKNILYKTNAKLKSTAGYKYRLVVYNPETEKTVYGETKVITDIITGISFNSNSVITISSETSASTFEWKSTTNARIYTLSMTFHYFEIDKTSGVKTNFAIPIKIGTTISPDASGGDPMSIDLTANTLLNGIASAVSPNDNVYRVVRENSTQKTIDLMFNIGGDALYTYMEVNAPTFGLIQEKPEYTNITNGIGLISSVFSKKYTNRKISLSTVNLIANSSITKNLGFVDAENILFSGQ
jgi:hypothetical protein